MLENERLTILLVSETFFWGYKGSVVTTCHDLYIQYEEEGFRQFLLFLFLSVRILVCKWCSVNEITSES